MRRSLTPLMLGLLITIAGIFAQAASAGAAGGGSLAPLNPEFAAYMKQKAKGLLPLTSTPGGHGLGYIPSPVDWSHLKTQRTLLGASMLQTFPPSYDLRTLNKLTPVRNQGSCGDCWAFGTFGSLESALMPGESDDFSENNLKNLSGFDLSPCSGGTYDMSTAYLVRWDGPVSEAADPYDPVDYNTSPSGLAPVKHVQDVVILPARTGPTDNNIIKNAVMTWGAVGTSIYASNGMAGSYNDGFYNPVNYSYYYSGNSLANHAVDIIGWDDNYPAANFSTLPQGNGAFIVRNSWGTSWGDNGYFYVSYYDTAFAMSENYVFDDGEATSNYSRIYQYDPLGATEYCGYGTNTAWFKNVFTAASSENLTAVGFYAPAINTAYDIYVFPDNATLALHQQGTITNAGYYTIALSSPVLLTSGVNFSIEIKLTTPGYNYPVAIEYPLSGYSSSATASPGQSYISPDGTTWTDMTTIYPNTNVCLKAYTGSGGASSWNIAGTGDFNGDLKKDILLRDPSTGAVDMWLMNGTSMSSWATVYPGGDPNWTIAGTGDFNGDGKADILWRNTSTGQVTMWLMNGTAMSSWATVLN